MSFAFFINLIAFFLILFTLAALFRFMTSFSLKVFTALLAGVVFGSLLHLIYGSNHPILKQSSAWFDIIGNGYIALLQMTIMPLIFISILSAVTRLRDISSLKTVGFLNIGFLLLTTMISALIGVMIVHFFNLSADGLIQGSAETARLQLLETHYSERLSGLNFPQLLVSFIPRNPFAELTGAHSTSVISVVIFATFLGIAAINFNHSHPEKGERCLAFIDMLQLWIIQFVRMIIRLTPYGIFALMIKMIAVTDLSALLKLGIFIIASYVAIFFIFATHAGLLAIFSVNPWQFFKKIAPVLLFAFTSRSSSATLPLTIEAQTHRLGISQAIAGFSASIGTIMGQNGCAGLYPAMLAAMIAPTLGINPLDPTWLITLILIVALSSIGVAGVGGGATFSALIVLPAMGFPVTLVALLISIEPLIDMGRTALNVSGSIVSGTLTSKILKQTNQKIFLKNTDKILNSTTS